MPHRIHELLRMGDTLKQALLQSVSWLTGAYFLAQTTEMNHNWINLVVPGIVSGAIFLMGNLFFHVWRKREDRPDMVMDKLEEVRQEVTQEVVDLKERISRIEGRMNGHLYNGG